MAPPGLLPALCLVAGVVAGSAMSVNAWPAACVMPVACLAAGGFWIARRPGLVTVSVAAGMLAGGLVLGADASTRALHPSARDLLDREYGGFQIESTGPAEQREPVLARLVLTEDASPRDGFVGLRARLVALRLHGAWHGVEGGVQISVSGSAAPASADRWRAGRAVEAPVLFRRPARFLNEGVADAERDQALDGVTLLGSVKSGLLVSVVAPGSRGAEAAAAIRAHVRRAIFRWIGRHDPLSAAIAVAVLIGDRTGLPPAVRDSLQAAGTYHVIAISGGNIAVLASVATLVLLLAGVRGRRAASAAIVILAGYAAVITAGPSVWRATVMAMLFFAARALDHRTAAWQTVSVSAALMAVASPLDVRDPGFILTFGATIALLEGARVATRFAPGHRMLAWAVASCVASAAVEVALLPVSARLFSRVTGAGLLLNLLAVPLMGIVQMAGLTVAIASNVPSIAAPSGWVAHQAARALVASAALVKVAPWSTARVPPPSLWLIGVYYAALVTCATGAKRPLRAAAALALALAGALIVLGRDPFRAESLQTPGLLRLTMFDVGQGESVLLEAPGGERLLIDAGGSPFGGGAEIGTRVLAPALWARGVRWLDALLVTHGDPDHVGGALDVWRDFGPSALWMGIPVPMHEPTRSLGQTAADRGVPLTLRRAGELGRLGALRLRVLHPPPPDWERRRVRNDDSVVIEVVYRDVAILLTGDISAEVEQAVLPRLTPARTRLLKVAHHGSRSSSSLALLEGWRPQIALISAGRGNTFGHPAPEVLARLRAVGATVLRTDRDGEITIESDGHGVTWRVFRSDGPAGS